MPAHPIIHYLHECGLSVRVDGGSLIVEPRHLITDTVRHYIRTHKAGIIAALQDEPPESDLQMRSVVPFRLQDGRGGVVIDPQGPLSALRDLIERYGGRLDLDDLQERFEERAAIMQFDGGLNQRQAEQEALELIQRLLQTNQTKSQRAEQ